jgi:hypothetical protein
MNLISVPRSSRWVAKLWRSACSGNQGSPDVGSPGPFRGQLGEVTEGSIRTFCFIRWLDLGDHAGASQRHPE